MQRMDWHGCERAHYVVMLRLVWELQGVNKSLYVYQEVMESCGELVQPTEYTTLGQVSLKGTAVPGAEEQTCSDFACQIQLEPSPNHMVFCLPG
jgi:hypothetical protein